jgi:putative two-component system response regulator
VTSQFVTVDDKPYILEIVQNISDATLEGAFGGESFINQMKDYTDEIYTDSLTHISNRRYYDDQIKNLEMDGVAMIDVDSFKAINDHYGHLAGDAALAYVAHVLRQAVRADDSVIRYGGDEFLISFASIPENVFAMRLNCILEAVRKIRLEDFPDVRVTISIGGAYGRDSTLELMKAADQVLYVAKKTRNCAKMAHHVK